MNRIQFRVLIISCGQYSKSPRGASGRQGIGAMLIWTVMPKTGTQVKQVPAPDGAKLLLVCPYNLFREALATLLEKTPFSPVAQAASATEAAEFFVGDHAIEIVLLCACDHDADEHDFIARVCGENPATNIVLLTTKFDSTHMTESLNAGVDGYLVADISPEALLHSLELVRHGERVFPSQLAAELTGGILTATTPPELDGSGLLSPREQEIVGRLVEGDSNKAIAVMFGITEATVKMHLRQIFSKIGAVNRTQAAAWAINNGWSKLN